MARIEVTEVSDFTIQTTYRPDLGRFGHLPGPDKPAMRQGGEFWKLMEKRSAENSGNKAKRSAFSKGPGKYDPAALETFRRETLTNSKLAALAAKLAEKYDPSNMTQEELDSFMDDLVEEGLLSKDELGALGYHGIVVLGSSTDMNWGGVQTRDTGDPAWKIYSARYGYANSLEETNGNALAYTKLMSLLKDPSGSADFVKYAQTRHDGFAIMAKVLEAIQYKRES